jgi:hypothetical protein
VQDENVSSELAEANPVSTSEAAVLLSKLTANERDRAPTGQFKAKEPAETVVESEEPAKVVDLKGQPVETAEAPAEDDEDLEFEFDAGEEGKEPVRRKLSELVEGYERAQKLEAEYNELKTKAQTVPDEFFKSIEENNKVRSAYAQKLDIVERLTKPTPPAISLVDPNSPDYDPERYHALARKYQDDTKLLQAVNAERERIQSEQTAEQQRMSQAIMAREWAKLEQAWPEFKAKETQDAYVKTLRDYGFSDEEIKNNMDSRAFQIVRDAMKYRDLAAKKVETAKVARSKPKLVKGAARSTTNPANTARTNALSRLKETGSVEAAAAALKGLI